MNDQLEFDEWMSDFQKKHSHNSDPNSKNILFEIAGFPPEKRVSFINELMNRDVYSSLLIDKYGTDNQKKILKEKAVEYLNSNTIDSQMLEYLLVIIRNYTNDDLKILTRYFIDLQYENRIRIPKELYYLNQELYLKSFIIYLENYPIDKLSEHIYILDLKQYELVAFLIKNLPFKLSEKLKLHVLSQFNYTVYDKKSRYTFLELAEFKKWEIDRIIQHRLKIIKERQMPTNLNETISKPLFVKSIHSIQRFLGMI